LQALHGRGAIAGARRRRAEQIDDVHAASIDDGRHRLGIDIIEPSSSLAWPMIFSASANSDSLERCVMSPVWIMKAGLAGNALMRPIASSSVPLAFGLAGLSKPIWLSLICRKVKPFCSAPSA
jgi:hypothetical protein